MSSTTAIPQATRVSQMIRNYQGKKMKFTPKNIITYVGNMLAKIIINMGSRSLVGLAYCTPVIGLAAIANDLLATLGITSSTQAYVAMAITFAVNAVVPGVNIV